MRLVRLSTSVLFLCIAVLALAACQSLPPAPSRPALKFDGQPPLELMAATITLQDDLASPSTSASVQDASGLSPVSFQEVIDAWKRDRLRTVGNGGVLDITINRAELLREALPRTKGVKGAFTKDQAEKFTARLALTLKLRRGDEVLSSAEASAEAYQSRTLREDATLAAREDLLEDMMVDVMKIVDDQLTREIKDHWGDALSSPDAADSAGSASAK